MRKNKFLQVAMIIAAATACVGCSKEPKIPETPSKEIVDVKGEIDFAAKNDKGENVSLDFAKSIEVKSNNEKLYFSIASMYNEVSVEAKASLEIVAPKDTVILSGLEEIKNIFGNSKVSENGTAKKVVASEQRFKIGDSNIGFKSKYEKYVHTQKNGQKIMLPYLKIDTAKIGKIVAEKMGSRATVTDTNYYEVKVKFNVNAECVNVKKPETKVIGVDVGFIALVREDKELPDPEPDSGIVNYTMKAEGTSGKGTSSDPYQINSASAELTMHQVSTFTDADGRKITERPKCIVKINKLKDTIWCNNVNDFKAIKLIESKADSTGNNPVEHKTSKKFNAAGNEINIGLYHEVFQYKMMSGKTIDMPYMKFSDAVITDIVATPVSYVTRATTAKKYNIKARIEIPVENVNTKKAAEGQKIHADVNFVGVIKDKEVPTLLKTSYEKNWRWIEPHDNMRLALYCKVKRIREYSDGTLQTDKFEDIGHTTLNTMAIEPRSEFPSSFVITNDGVKDSVKYLTVEQAVKNDSVRLYKHTTIVNDINFLKTQEEDYGWGEVKFGEYDKYYPNHMYDEDNGWYSTSISFSKMLCIKYKGSKLIYISLKPMLPDTFLKIGEEIIRFDDELPIYKWQVIKEDLPATDEYGIGKKIIYQCKIHYKGKNFLLRGEESFYNKK